MTDHYSSHGGFGWIHSWYDMLGLPVAGGNEPHDGGTHSHGCSQWSSAGSVERSSNTSEPYRIIPYLSIIFYNATMWNRTPPANKGNGHRLGSPWSLGKGEICRTNLWCHCHWSSKATEATTRCGLDHFKTNKPSYWPKCQRKDGHLLFLFGFRSVLEKEALQTVSITELFHSICLQPWKRRTEYFMLGQCLSCAQQKRHDGSLLVMFGFWQPGAATTARALVSESFFTWWEKDRKWCVQRKTGHGEKLHHSDVAILLESDRKTFSLSELHPQPDSKTPLKALFQTLKVQGIPNIWESASLESKNPITRTTIIHRALSS